MNVSYEWLRALAPGIDDSPDTVADRLAMYGAPADEIEHLGGGIGDIVVARVERVREHPNADRLRLCDVDAGTGELLQVVCGAPNVRADAYYPFAPVGAALPGGMEIRKAKIRGQASQGMLCSERELGLGRSHEGLMELSGRFEAGEPFIQALGLDDVRLVLDVTPNRPDLLSHLGVARELAPGGVEGVRLPGLPEPDADAGPLAIDRAGTTASTAGVSVTIEDPHACPRYLGAVIRGVRVGPSPAWLAARLRAVGLRPINNVVDATNYVLYELGQPLHAFDLARLSGPQVRVRRAGAGETIVTLDGERRTLDADMLVIADADAPIAVAGVMGGQDSEVDEETSDVFLECALFDPRGTRRTRRALGLSTDASYRFERGVDPTGAERALRRAIDVIRSVAGGSVEGPAIDLHPEPVEPRTLELRPARVEQVLGVQLSANAIAKCLEPLGFEQVGVSGDALRFSVPGWRSFDVEREIDLVEEVARRHGYDAFPAEMRASHPGTVPDDEVAALEGRLREFFVGRGFLESRTAAFAPEAEGDVALLYPLSSEESRLRRAITPSLVHRVEYNFARGVRDIRLFEIATVFGPAPAEGEQPQEETRVAAVLTGRRHPPHWGTDEQVFDLWDLKGLLGAVAHELGRSDATIRRVDADAAPDEDVRGVAQWLAGPVLELVTEDGTRIARGGRVDPAAVDAPPWTDPVWALEADLSHARLGRSELRYRPIPAHPASERDLALLVPDTVAAGVVRDEIRATAGDLLEAVDIFDVFRGNGVPEDARSIAYRLRFRAPDRTLTDAEVDAAVERVLGHLGKSLGVERRG